MQIELTREEAQTLFNIIDVALKSGGLQIADACTHFAKKLSDAAKADVEKSREA